VGKDAHRPAAEIGASSLSKRCTCGPEVIQPERRTSDTAAMVSSSISGRANGM
jgi:hypothetical protein